MLNALEATRSLGASGSADFRRRWYETPAYRSLTGVGWGAHSPSLGFLATPTSYQVHSGDGSPDRISLQPLVHHEVWVSQERELNHVGPFDDIS